ncbi:flagellar export chaperone FlgN [Syntrophomonas erecta]
MNGPDRKLINQVQAVYDKMLAITEQQLEVIIKAQNNKEEIYKLQELIEQRQVLIKQINQLTGGSSEWIVEESTPGKAADQEWRKAVDYLQDTMTGIQKINQRCQELLQVLMEDTGEKLTRQRKTHQAVNAYTGSDHQDEAWFFDKKK